MSTLLDTNLIARCAQPHHPLYQVTVDAIAVLHGQGEQLCLVPQIFYEFWVVATRPIAQNGLDLSPAQTQAEFVRLKSFFAVFDDTPDLFVAWVQLIGLYQV